MQGWKTTLRVTLIYNKVKVRGSAPSPFASSNVPPPSPPGAEKDSPMAGEPQRMSPKVSSLAPSSTSGHLGLSGGSAPPVVTIAPTHSHGITSEAERSSAAAAAAAASEDLVRGFQPYRAPDVQPTPPAGTPGASLRPPMPPLDLPPSYPPYHPSLYPHHLAHQYR